MGVEVNEVVVIISEAKEGHYIMLIGWDGPLSDGLNFGWVSGNAVMTNDVANKLDGVFCKRAFLHFGVKIIAVEFLEDKADML
jgi:hypothetical protein